MINRRSRQTAALICLASIVAACGNGPDSATDHYATQVLDTPAAPGSLAPNLVTGAGGTVVLSWIEVDGDTDSLRFAVFENESWHEKGTAATGENWFVNWADFPSVVPVTESLWAAHWLVRRAAGGYAYDIHAVISDDAGQTWSQPFKPHSDGTDTEHGFVTFFPSDDRVGMLWLDGRKMVNEYDEDDVGASGMTLRAATFGADMTPAGEVLVDDLICDCCQTDVAVTSEGPVAVYRNRTVDEIRDIHLSRFVDGEWQPGTAVGDDNWEIPGCPVNGPVIQADGSNIAVAWFSAANAQPKVQVAWSNNAGQSLSDPVSVATGVPLGRVGAAMLPTGDMAVTWLGKAGDGAAELQIRRVSPTGESGPVRVLAEAAGVAAFSVPQVILAGGKLLLAWTDKSGDQSRVRTALVPLQFLD